MKRRILIPLDDDEIRNDEIERINRETRRLEEEAAHAERVREATAARDAAQERLTAAQRDPRRVVGTWTPYEPPTTNPRWRVSGIEPPVTTRTADEIISEAFGEAKQEEPKVELQKVDAAKFVFLWENSTSVTDVAFGMQHPRYQGGVSEADIALARKLAEVIRKVEDIPLRELPDERPTVKRGRIQNFS